MKRCNGPCGLEKPLADFPVDRTKKDGHRGQCKECCRIARAQYVKDNPEKVKACNAKWRAAHPDDNKRRSAVWRVENPGRVIFNNAQYKVANPEKVAAHKTRWRRNNLEKARAIEAAYRARNPDKVKESTRRNGNKRRAWRAANGHEPYDFGKICEEWKWRCLVCGEPCDPSLKHPHPMSLQVGHLISLARGGSDTADNVAPIHKFCNEVQSTKPWFEVSYMLQ